MLNVDIDGHRMQIGQRFAVSFQRTLRIPDDGHTYPLPPGLGSFPLRKVEDYRDRVPQHWLQQGGVFIPMYQREALWLSFSAASWKPNAVKIAIGGINAITGEPDDNQLRADPQNYIVCPNQPWLDGIHTGQNSIRQFVAMPLGQGYTVEASLTGTEALGGIQIVVFEPKPGKFPDKPPPVDDNVLRRARSLFSPAGFQSMGVGAGGVIQQKIYPDPYGLDTWDEDNYGRIFIHILNSLQFQALTGQEPPPTPIAANTYTEYGLPWFALYDETKVGLAASDPLNQAKTISERDTETAHSAEDTPSFAVPESQIKLLDLENPH
ncbi:hypothetical protein K9N68_34690 (plasmid) [Kovacikia minuta CCNUW1]|uniref:hypothetical protein n=1 Tax=Kovacikia minuta TaxID=2931930 RepID=UPI001CCDE3D0|nr:hypothetical protein [Kovacikia minuta]UBF30355.1 hypothetical protein K9N68_34690 [Kovacikia minuta CCNUW1]